MGDCFIPSESSECSDSGIQSKALEFTVNKDLLMHYLGNVDGLSDLNRKSVQMNNMNNNKNVLL